MGALPEMGELSTAHLVFIVAVAGVSFLIRSLIARVDKHDAKFTEVETEVKTLIQTLPNIYVRRDDNDKQMNQIFDMLRDIQNTLKDKVDKH